MEWPGDRVWGQRLQHGHSLDKSSQYIIKMEKLNHTIFIPITAIWRVYETCSDKIIER